MMKMTRLARLPQKSLGLDMAQHTDALTTIGILTKLDKQGQSNIACGFQALQLLFSASSTWRQFVSS